MTPDYSPETFDRIARLERIRALGVNPYATKFGMNTDIATLNTRDTA